MEQILLTVATVFNLINGAKKMQTNNYQYTTEDIQLSRNYLLKLSQTVISIRQLIPYNVESNKILSAKYDA